MLEYLITLLGAQAEEDIEEEEEAEKAWAPNKIFGDRLCKHEKFAFFSRTKVGM